MHKGIELLLKILTVMIPVERYIMEINKGKLCRRWRLKNTILKSPKKGETSL